MNDESAKLTQSAGGGEDFDIATFDVTVMLYLDDLLDDEQLLSLRSLLCESDVCRERFVAICSQTGQLREGFATQQLGTDEKSPEQSPDSVQPASRWQAVATQVAERASTGAGYLAGPLAVLAVGGGGVDWLVVGLSCLAQSDFPARHRRRLPRSRQRRNSPPVLIWARECQVRRRGDESFASARS